MWQYTSILQIITLEWRYLYCIWKFHGFNCRFNGPKYPFTGSANASPVTQFAIIKSLIDAVNFSNTIQLTPNLSIATHSVSVSQMKQELFVVISFFPFTSFTTLIRRCILPLKTQECHRWDRNCLPFRSTSDHHRFLIRSLFLIFSLLCW